MRLVEFYNPEFDEFVKRNEEDSRSPKLTLEACIRRITVFTVCG